MFAIFAVHYRGCVFSYVTNVNLHYSSQVPFVVFFKYISRNDLKSLSLANLRVYGHQM